jgi:predicted CoA-binding protein
MKVKPNLAAVGLPVDMVEVLCKPKDLYGLAEEAGLKELMNHCPKIELFRPFWKPRLHLEI